jgi:hypothetical protein
MKVINKLQKAITQTGYDWCVRLMPTDKHQHGLKNQSKPILLMLAAIFLSASLLSTTANSASSRPPQYILFSFDGSYNLGTWKAIRDFTKAEKTLNKDIRFTFFMSGVYFLQPSNRTQYLPPRRNPGRSDIGVGDSTEDIALRIDQVNRAILEKHEMGSHANGHFDGGSWSESEWNSEFSQFNKLIFQTFTLNNINPVRPVANGWLMTKENIKGFRAPLLATNTGLWTTLKNYKFAYDCSRTAASNYWPEKKSTGTWNFPLADLKISGTSKNTLSMDYNFYVAQSGGAPDAANKEVYKKQMYDTYSAWFQRNYYGNRAPINIGHHFSMWNGGAYFESLKKFASAVCGLPEVKCVTYTEYVKWLDSLNAQTLIDFRKGLFPKLSKPLDMVEIPEPINTTVALGLRKAGVKSTVFVRPNVPQMKDLQELKSQISLDGGEKIDKPELTLKDIRHRVAGRNKAQITTYLYDRQGIEIARATHILRDIQSNRPQLSSDIEKGRAMKGDLPEAHMDERNTAYDPNNLE